MKKLTYFMCRLGIIYMCLFSLITNTTDTAVAAEIYITRSGYIAAETKEMMELVVSCIVANDTATTDMLLRQYPNKVFWLKGNMQVYIEKETGGRGNLTKLRIAGSTETFWTIQKAIY